MADLHITGITVLPLDRPQNKSKLQYIKLFIQELVSKSYCFLRPADRHKFVWQATAYKLNKKKNKDDWMDVAAMGMTVRNMHSNVISTRRTQVKNNRGGVRSGNTPF